MTPTARTMAYLPAKRGGKGKRKLWTMTQVVVDAGMFPDQLAAVKGTQ